MMHSLSLTRMPLYTYHMGREKGAAMIVKVTSKRQVTFPARVLDALGVQPGDDLEIREGPDGFTLHPRRIDLSLLAPLRDKIDPGHEPFDIKSFRRQTSDPSLRD